MNKETVMHPNNEWHSEIKRNEPSTHETVWMNLKWIYLVKETRHKWLHTVFHFDIISEKVKLYIEKKLPVVTKGIKMGKETDF